jgi:hypothetical protein
MSATSREAGQRIAVGRRTRRLHASGAGRSLGIGSAGSTRADSSGSKLAGAPIEKRGAGHGAVVARAGEASDAADGLEGAQPAAATQVMNEAIRHTLEHTPPREGAGGTSVRHPAARFPWGRTCVRGERADRRHAM